MTSRTRPAPAPRPHLCTGCKVTGHESWRCVTVERHIRCTCTCRADARATRALTS